ncbi:MAG: hypothetical protein K9I71_06520 [Ignavibacteriales bacterium]|nr:hypothetical protein [Ignavibacteriales bacterium]MCF8315757.1 hypothetical protein [Ignavibacteriales bacterium]MCF8437049.1 hypothetical protein [Ignavibacteriales bacterium]
MNRERGKEGNKRYEYPEIGEISRKILGKISTILAEDTELFTPAHADAIAKLNRALSVIADVHSQIPAILFALKEFTIFLHNEYPHLLTDELLDAIEQFKEKVCGE